MTPQRPAKRWDRTGDRAGRHTGVRKGGFRISSRKSRVCWVKADTAQPDHRTPLRAGPSEVRAAYGNKEMTVTEQEKRQDCIKLVKYVFHVSMSQESTRDVYEIGGSGRGGRRGLRGQSAQGSLPPLGRQTREAAAQSPADPAGGGLGGSLPSHSSCSARRTGHGSPTQRPIKPSHTDVHMYAGTLHTCQNTRKSFP